MKIQKINIKHYLCFEDKEISFHPQFNVIIGENGSGKTAVLDAIAKFVAIGISVAERLIYATKKMGKLVRFFAHFSHK